MKSLVLCAALVSLSAFAGQAQQQQQAQRALPKGTLTWENLKAACKDPVQFQRQNAPKEIKVTCEDLQYSWEAIEAGRLPLARTRTIESAVVSDKFNVNLVSAQWSLEASPQACARYQQIAERVSLPVDLTCAQVLAFDGDLTKFCTLAVDKARAETPEVVRRSPVKGAVVTTCPTEARQQDARQQDSRSQKR